jgi:hypothetical protein
MHLEIEPQPDHLLVVVSELFDHAQMADALNVIFAASTKHGLRKIIIDHTRLEGEFSLMVRYDFGRMLAEFQREPVRIAVVGTEDQVWPDRFAENVANNRGVKTKVSTDMTEALEWLHRDSVS